MSRKRIAYLPGMISLLALCPLLVFQLHHWNVFEKNYVLDVTWPDPAGKLHNKYYQQPIPGINYRTVTFNGDKVLDDQKITYAKDVIRTIATQTVTPKMIRFHFTATARYESFAQILSFCDKEQKVLCVLHPNDCWVFNKKAREEACCKLPTRQ